MTIAEHVYAQWAVLQPDRVLLSVGLFKNPDLNIPRAVGSQYAGAYWQWKYEDGSVIYRGNEAVLSLRPPKELIM